MYVHVLLFIDQVVQVYWRLNRDTDSRVKGRQREFDPSRVTFSLSDDHLRS